MSLNGCLLVPVDDVKYKTSEEALLAWEKGLYFKIPLSERYYTIFDCGVGEVVGLVYQYPNFAHIVRYEQTSEKINQIVNKHFNSFGIKKRPNK